MIEKILERLEAESRYARYSVNTEGIMSIPLYKAKEIVQEVAKGYGKDTNVRSNGWIPCSERLPSERDWYLAVFEEPDTGFTGLPFIADYLMGTHTKYTTEDGWIIANCTDIEEERAEYYKKLKCIAWQPLPAPYQKGEI